MAYVNDYNRYGNFIPKAYNIRKADLITQDLQPTNRANIETAYASFIANGYTLYDIVDNGGFYPLTGLTGNYLCVWKDFAPAILASPRSGTCGGTGSTTTIKLDAGASNIDDYYNGMQVAWTNGLAANMYNIIIDYVGSTHTATVARTYTVAPTSSATFTVGDYFYLSSTMITSATHVIATGWVVDDALRITETDESLYVQLDTTNTAYGNKLSFYRSNLYLKYAGSTTPNYLLTVPQNGNTIISNDSGATWALITGNITHSRQWIGVAYGKGTIIACYGGYIQISHDNGVTWTAKTMSHYTNYIYYNNGRFIVTEDGLTWIGYSDDLGETWTWQDVGYIIPELGIGDGLIMGCTSGGYLVKSFDNGTTWGTYTPATNMATKTVYCGSNKWVTVSGATCRYSSDNGATWTAVAITNYDWDSIAYGDGMVVCVGHDSTTRSWIGYSTNYGATWSYSGISGTYYNGSSIKYFAGRFMCFAANVTHLYYAYNTAAGISSATAWTLVDTGQAGFDVNYAIIPGLYTYTGIGIDNCNLKRQYYTALKDGNIFTGNNIYFDGQADRQTFISAAVALEMESNKFFLDDSAGGHSFGHYVFKSDSGYMSLKNCIFEGSDNMNALSGVSFAPYTFTISTLALKCVLFLNMDNIYVSFSIYTSLGTESNIYNYPAMPLFVNSIISIINPRLANIDRQSFLSDDYIVYLFDTIAITTDRNFAALHAILTVSPKNYSGTGYQYTRLYYTLAFDSGYMIPDSFKTMFDQAGSLLVVRRDEWLERIDDFAIYNLQFLDESDNVINYRNNENFFILTAEGPILAWYNGRLCTTKFSGDYSAGTSYTPAACFQLLEPPSEPSYSFNRLSYYHDDMPIEGSIQFRDVTNSYVLY